MLARWRLGSWRQTSAGAEVEEIFIRSFWYVMEKRFLFVLVSCCVVQKYIVYRVLSSMMWAAAVAVSYITTLLIQWHNNFSHLILLFQLHWRAPFLSPWHHAIKRHLPYIILYILLYSGGSGGVASWYKCQNIIIITPAQLLLNIVVAGHGGADKWGGVTTCNMLRWSHHQHWQRWQQ